MLNTIFNHIKNHKLWYGIGTFVVLIALVVVSYNTSSSFKKFSSNLVGNMEFMEMEWMGEMEFLPWMEEERGSGREVVMEEEVRERGGEERMEERGREVVMEEEVRERGSEERMEERGREVVMEEEVRERGGEERMEERGERRERRGEEGNQIINDEEDNRIADAGIDLKKESERHPDFVRLQDTVSSDGLRQVPMPSGTIKVNQSGASGLIGTITVKQSGTTNKFAVTTSSYTNTNVSPDAYSIQISSPNGYAVDKVTDWTAKNVLMSPFDQNLADKGTVVWNINYKKAISPTQTGYLEISSTSGSIPSGIVTSSSKQLASQYTFTAKNEAFTVNKLTIINDDTSKSGFDDTKEMNAIDKVTISYPDPDPTKKGQMKDINASLSSGSYTFSGLDFYIPKDKSATLKVYANAQTITWGMFSLSGKKFSLGLKDNSTKSQFEAIGASSNNSVYIDKPGSIKDAINVPIFVVRKSKPMFTEPVIYKDNPMPSTGPIYQFKVQADSSGSISLARLVFEINTAGLTDATADVYGFTLHSGGTAISGHHIWGHGTQSTGTNTAVYLKDSIKSNGLKNANSGTGVTNGKYYAVVTFDNKESIAAGASKTYVLRASVSGASTDDTLKVNLASSEGNEVSLGAGDYDNDNGIGNTGQIIGTSSGTYPKQDIALFDNNLGTAHPGDDENEFFGDTVSDWVNYRNVIWSDQSGGDFASGTSGMAAAAIHTYPTITGSSTSGVGTVKDSSGTLDWTNGYQLNINNLMGASFKQ